MIIDNIDLRTKEGIEEFNRKAEGKYKASRNKLGEITVQGIVETTPLRENPFYLTGLIDGYNIQEPIDSDDFPEGFSNINEIWDSLNKIDKK